jgi:hypothetical protein
MSTEWKVGIASGIISSLILKVLEPMFKKFLQWSNNPDRPLTIAERIQTEGYIASYEQMIAKLDAIKRDPRDVFFDIIRMVVAAALSFVAALFLYPYRPTTTPVVVMLVTLGVALCGVVFGFSYIYSNAHIDGTRARYQKYINASRSRLSRGNPPRSEG